MSPSAENIRLLSLFHYVLGTLTYLSALFPIFHLAAGLFLLLAPMEEWAENPPGAVSQIESVEPSSIEANADFPASSAEVIRQDTSNDLRKEDIWIMRGVGGLFTGFAVAFMLGAIILATLMILAGRRLAQHRSHTFCLIVAGLECMMFPFHSILGIFTFILLLQPEGRALFGASSAPSDGD